MKISIAQESEIQQLKKIISKNQKQTKWKKKIKMALSKENLGY